LILVVCIHFYNAAIINYALDFNTSSDIENIDRSLKVLSFYINVDSIESMYVSNYINSALDYKTSLLLNKNGLSSTDEIKQNFTTSYDNLKHY
jgi:hypothetical protein